MNPRQRAKSQDSHERVIKESGFGHVLIHPFVETSISLITERDIKMTYDQQDLDATIIILGLGYACTLLAIIHWVAAL
jgi:hypothetical protein